MRLIDADALREKAREMDLCAAVTVWDIDDAPTIDAVEVVRCKDCKHWKKFRDNRGCCKQETFTLDDDTIDPVTEPNDFCSYGRRQEDATD